MKTLYLDIFSGISGDMFIGAMLDLGVRFSQLEIELAKLRLDGYRLELSRKMKSSIEGSKFDVHLAPSLVPSAHGDHDHGHSHSHEPGHSHSHAHAEERTFTDIQQLISRSTLSDWVKQKSISVFRRVAVAEGKIHGQPPESVHFHEVGAVDSIIDIVGACVCLELLGQPRVISAPVIEGTGWVDCAHGRFPVPTTATLEILGARQIAVSQCDEPQELVTPTGAALLAEFAESFSPLKNFAPEKIGYGLGTRGNKTRPNVLRAVFGSIQATETMSAASVPDASHHDWESDTVFVLETNLDNINAELLGDFMDQALATGALDVFYTPIQMKKNRPAILLSLLCPEADSDRFTEMILTHTTALGVRRHACSRRKLLRRLVTIELPEGKVTVKIGSLDGRLLHAAPEFESCKAVAQASGSPVKTVYQRAFAAAQRLLTDQSASA